MLAAKHHGSCTMLVARHHGSCTMLAAKRHGSCTMLAAKHHGSCTMLVAKHHGSCTMLVAKHHGSCTMLAAKHHGSRTMLVAKHHGSCTMLVAKHHGSCTMLVAKHHGSCTMLVAKPSVTPKTLNVEISDYNRITSTKSPSLSVTTCSASPQTWQSSHLSHMIAPIIYANTGTFAALIAYLCAPDFAHSHHSWHQPSLANVTCSRSCRLRGITRVGTLIVATIYL